MADTEQREAENFGREHGFIIRSHDARFAITLDRFDELQDQRPARLGLQRFEPQRRVARVLQNAEDEVCCSVEIGLTGEVDSPDEISRNRLGLRIR